MIPLPTAVQPRQHQQPNGLTQPAECPVLDRPALASHTTNGTHRTRQPIGPNPAAQRAAHSATTTRPRQHPQPCGLAQPALAYYAAKRPYRTRQPIGLTDPAQLFGQNNGHTAAPPPHGLHPGHPTETPSV